MPGSPARLGRPGDAAAALASAREAASAPPRTSGWKGLSVLPARFSVEHLADFHRQFLTAIGLAEQVDAAVETPVMHDGVFGVAGGKQHLETGPQRLGRVGELPAIHAARHHDVSEQQIDIGDLSERVERLRPVIGDDHAITEKLKLLKHIFAHVLVVLDQEDAFGAAGDIYGAGTRQRRLVVRIGARQIELDRRALTKFGINLYMAPIV